MLKIDLKKQTVYRLINTALKEEKQYNDIELAIEYMPVVLRKLQKYIDADTMQKLHREFGFKDTFFMLVAKYRKTEKGFPYEEIAYAVNRKFNHAVTMFGSDQLGIEGSNIVQIVNTDKSSYALIPIEDVYISK